MSAALIAGSFALLAPTQAQAAVGLGCEVAKDTLTSDFAAGTVSGVSLATNEGGEVTLPLTQGWRFDDGVYPSSWINELGPMGVAGLATVANGTLNVDGVTTGPLATWGQNTTLDFDAKFTSEPFQHAGFTVNYQGADALAFSTQYDGKLYTYTNGVVRQISSNYLNSWHHYRIQRTASTIRYFVDGVQVATGTYANATPLRPLFSDSNVGTPLVVDNLAVSPYAASGNLVSRVFDAGASSNWTSANWSANVPASTSLAVSVRGGSTSTPSGSWTGWQPLATSGASIGIAARYVQYRLELATTAALDAPVVRDITLHRVLNEELCGSGNFVSDGGADGFTDGVSDGVVGTPDVITLDPGFGSTFSGSELPDNWHGGAGAVVSGGSVLIDGATLSSDGAFGPGTTLTFRAKFSGDQYEHAGFAIDYINPNAFAFSTRSGGVLAAYTNGVETYLSPSYLNSWHAYTIDRGLDTVTYSIDGVVVATHASPTGIDLTPVFTNNDLGGKSLLIDDVALSPHYRGGSYTSRVLDAEQQVAWTSAVWVGDESDEASIGVFVRTGDSSSVDETWSDWRQVGFGGIVGGESRYIQYRAELESISDLATPVLNLIRFNWTEVAPPPTTTTTTIVVIPQETTTTTTAPPPPPHYDTAVSVSAANVVYGSSSVHVDATVSSEVAVEGGHVSFTLVRDGTSQGPFVVAVEGGHAVGDFPLAIGTPVGAYSVVANYLGTSTFSDASAATDVAVLPASLTVSVSPAHKIYGAANPVFAVSVAGFVAGDSEHDLVGSLQFSTLADAASSVGHYAVSASGLSSSNYTISFVDGDLEVGRAQLTVTVDSAAKHFGSPNPAFSAHYDGFVNGDTIASLGGALVFDTEAGAQSDVGSYVVSASGLTSGNYEISYLSGLLTVSRAAVIVQVHDASATYGAPLPVFGADVIGLPDGVDASALGTLSITSAANVGSDVGYYTIEGSGLSSSNFDIEVIPGTLTINAAPLEVRVNDATKDYGAALPAFSVTFDGFAVGDGETSLKGSLSFDTLATAASPVGSYAVDASGLVSGNYDITFVSGSLAIAPVGVTVTVANSTKAYGAALPVFSADVVGLVSDDTFLDLGTLGFSTDATAASPVGAYAVTASGLTSSNYVISYVSGTLAVQPVALSIRADNKSKVYGSANPVLTATSVGFVNGDSVASLSGALVLSTTATASSAVGSYAITASGVASANYVISFVPATLSVTKAALVITADDKSRLASEANPVLTATYAGFVNGDSAARLSGTLVLSTTATTSSPAGTYPISVSGVTSTNYNITFVNGVLTITEGARCDVTGGLRDENSQKKRAKGKLKYHFNCDGQIGKIILSKWKLQRQQLDCKTLGPKGNLETIFVYKADLASIIALLRSTKYGFDEEFSWADEDGGESCWKLKLVFDAGGSIDTPHFKIAKQDKPEPKNDDKKDDKKKK